MTLTPDREVENDCGDWGSYTFTLRGKWTTPQTVHETVRLTTSAGDELEIPVTINVEVGNKYIYQTLGDWTDDDNWSTDNQPNASNEVEIKKPVTITTEVEVYSLEITGEGTVTIAATGGLTVYAGGISGADGKIRIRSTHEAQGYLRVSPEATTAMPEAIVEYATKGNLNDGANEDANWQYFGVPFETDFTVSNIMWLYQWSESAGWLSKTGVTRMQPFVGYAITQYGEPTYEYSGRLLQDNQTITLTKTPGAELEGENLIANSFMAPIDVKNFTDEDFTGDVDKTFYIYNAGSYNQWANNAQKTAVKSNTPGQFNAIPALSAPYLADEQTLIAPMQGIYMRTNEDGATVTFNYDKHVWRAESAGHMNDALRAPRRAKSAPAEELRHRARIQIESEHAGAAHVYLLERDGFTAGYDNGYDAKKIAGDIADAVGIYGNSGEGKMAVQAVDSLAGTYVGIETGKDTYYTLYVSAVIGDSLGLEDTYLHETILLEDGATYHFYAASNDDEPQRFRVVDLREKVEENVNITTATEAVEAEDAPVLIYTISGQRVATMEAGGVYIIKQGKRVFKVIR